VKKSHPFMLQKLALFLTQSAKNGTKCSDKVTADQATNAFFGRRMGRE